MRLALLLLAACWTSSAPAPREPTPSGRVVRAKAQPICTEATFDENDPDCREVCVAHASDGWPACVDHASALVGRGWTCTRANPFACLPPHAPQQPQCAPNCTPMSARVSAVSVHGAHIIVTISAGSQHGVDKTWRAFLVDANDKPIAGGEISVIRVDATRTTGKLRSTAQPSSFVRLQPP